MARRRAENSGARFSAESMGLSRLLALKAGISGSLRFAFVAARFRLGTE
jgi:hypothetical protein